MGYDDLLQRRPSATSRDPVSATVVSVDTEGVHVVPLDGDNRHPIGPCRGGVRYVLDVGELVVQQLPVGTVVLVVFTAAGPWVANWEGA